jgi:hydrogenase nickel incorporation protein HypB
MCLTCGCGDETEVRVLTLSDHSATGHPHEHRSGHHDHDHLHGPGHGHALLSDAEHQALHAGTRTVAIEEAILAKNDHLAEHNRIWLADRGITAFNLMSSPGSGGPSTRSTPSPAPCCSSRTSATWSARPCSTSVSMPRS